MLTKSKNKKERADITKELKIINKKSNFIKIKTAQGTAVVLTAAAVLSLLGLLISQQDRLKIVKNASANYVQTNYAVPYDVFGVGGGGGCYTCISGCVDSGCAGGGCGM